MTLEVSSDTGKVRNKEEKVRSSVLEQAELEVHIRH